MARNDDILWLGLERDEVDFIDSVMSDLAAGKALDWVEREDAHEISVVITSMLLGDWTYEEANK